MHVRSCCSFSFEAAHDRVTSLGLFSLLSILRLWRSITADMNRIIGMLKAGGLCSDVLYKELYIPQAEIDGEHPLRPVKSLHAGACFAKVMSSRCATVFLLIGWLVGLCRVELRTEGAAGFLGACQGQVLCWLWFIDLLLLSSGAPRAAGAKSSDVCH